MEKKTDTRGELYLHITVPYSYVCICVLWLDLIDIFLSITLEGGCVLQIRTAYVGSIYIFFSIHMNWLHLVQIYDLLAREC